MMLAQIVPPTIGTWGSDSCETELLNMCN